MDSGNHNVLQFVSAAAQALESQEGNDLGHDSLSGSSLYASPAWSDIRSTFTQSSDAAPRFRENEPEMITAMLAEASENILEESQTQSKVQEKSTECPQSPPLILLDEKSIERNVQTLFNLPDTEKLHSEWPCCIVRSAIVPGTLYLTDSHICFYASLQNTQQRYRKSGYLLIKASGKAAGNATRCYFELKNDGLSWYESATDTYSPLGKVDLKEVLVVRQSRKREYGFKLVTMGKTWYLQADTKVAMIEWINMFQKAIFVAKTAGNCLKIALPFENIFDIEQTKALEFQQFLQIRAVGIDDSFVMDEYYFAYFSDVKTTYQSLKAAWESSQKESQSSETRRSRYSTMSPSDSPNASPSLSISDLYDADLQPITIHALGGTSALSKGYRPGAAYLNPHAQVKPGSQNDASQSSRVHEPEAIVDDDESYTTSIFHGTTDYEGFSSSSDEEEQAMVGWLDEKRRSGMRLVYGLLGGNTGSAATVYNTDQSKETVPKATEKHQSLPQYEEPLDERTQLNFRKYFVLPEEETLYAVYRCSLMKTLPCYGKLYISSKHISFNSKGFATKAKMIIPLTDVDRVQKIRSRGYIFHALSILLQNKKEIFLEFSSLGARNSCFARLYLHHKWAMEDKDAPEQCEQEIKHWEAKLHHDEHYTTADQSMRSLRTGNIPILSVASDEPYIYKRPEKPLHFTCITIGTRGDVQPYIALCKGLMAEGHRCRIATHDEFKEWIEEHGIEFRSIGGDPSELMRLCVENSFFSVQFVVDGLRLFSTWLEELLELAWKACDGTDVLIESPSAMVGIHMAEKLGIPYFRAFPMPMTRTRSFPHPFATPNNPKGRLYNDMTYVLFDHALWRAIASRTNRFRQNVLHIPPTTYEKLEVWRIPHLYSFSSHIVPNPLDWMDWIHCTGYWFLDNPQTGWVPSEELQAFLSARDDRPIVYIGFGSIIVSDPLEITRIIVEATLLSNVRAIISKGWSSRLKEGSDTEFSKLVGRCKGTILDVPAVPHDWLFPKLRAVVHHGGAGTTAAGLRAGVPTIVKPFFADQFFWGDRIEEMGLGLCIKTLTVESLSAALRIVTTDEGMFKTCQKIGEKIRQEKGVETAIQCIYRDLDLAKARTVSTAQKSPRESDVAEKSLSSEDDQEWTLVDSETAGGTSADPWVSHTS